MTAHLLSDLLTKSARLYPDRPAVVSGDRKLTYRELDDITDRVAGKLSSLGVGLGDNVGIYVPKSLASVVCMFSVLKVGAAFVPLDPNAPTQRLAYMLGDSGAKALLTCSEKAGQLPALVPEGSPVGAVVFVDAEGTPAEKTATPLPAGVRAVSWDEALASTPLPEGSPRPTETSMAYMLYTSGSTGVPKGVMVSHRNCLTFVDWAGDCVGLTKEDRVSSHAPIHFDLSTFDIYSSIRAGATIVLVPEKASTFPVELVKLIQREKITVWYSVPSVLTLMLLYGNIQGHDLGSLRTVIFAGEVFPTKHLRNLMQLLPKPRYMNWYGPTETNVCTWYEVPTLDPGMTAPIPIGVPCDNTDVFSVREDGSLARLGEEGELYVRGPSVMLGYWGDKAKTERVLVRNPFNDRYFEQAYRTGDMVVKAGDGNYALVGRRDGMVKTRGYRVEIGEVEAAIVAHPGVKEAVAFPVPDELAGNLICALVVPLESSALAREEILAFCSQRLPKYMIPSTIEFRGSLPKTSTGKIDRAGLAMEYKKAKA